MERYNITVKDNPFDGCPYADMVVSDDGAYVRYDDAQRALDAERARVKELQGAASTPINELLAELISCAGVFDVSTDYEDDMKALETATQAVLDHVATLQAQVEGLEQGCFIHHIDLVSQLENTEAQLRQVEGERDHAKKMEAVQKEVADNQTWHVQKLKDWRDTVTLALQRPGGARFEDVPEHIKALVKEHATLRQLVEVHTKQLTELTIIPIGCSREQELRWTQSIKDLRAVLAAQDAGKEDVSHE